MRVLRLSIGKDPRLGLTRICPLRRLHLGRNEINLNVATSSFASELHPEQDAHVCIYAPRVLATRIHSTGMTNRLSLRCRTVNLEVRYLIKNTRSGNLTGGLHRIQLTGIFGPSSHSIP